jgi:hypothetical protein
MAFTENLSQFFETDDFGVEATINTSPSRTINVIFDTPTEGVQMYESSVEADAPVFECNTSDLAGVTVGNTATIGGSVYKIKKIRDDGTGVSRVTLKT